MDPGNDYGKHLGNLVHEMYQNFEKGVGDAGRLAYRGGVAVAEIIGGAIAAPIVVALIPTASRMAYGKIREQIEERAQSFHYKPIHVDAWNDAKASFKETFSTIPKSAGFIAGIYTTMKIADLARENPEIVIAYGVTNYLSLAHEIDRIFPPRSQKATY